MPCGANRLVRENWLLPLRISDLRIFVSLLPTRFMIYGKRMLLVGKRIILTTMQNVQRHIFDY